MNIAMMQPSFMPWLGYFELIYRSDIFIFLDDFQFSVQSYHQRNSLFVNKGQVDWYTVPVKKSVSFKLPLNMVQMDEAGKWRLKMWKRIQNNYGRSDFYRELAPGIEKWLLAPAASLAEQNLLFIKIVCELLGYKKEFRNSSKLGSNKERSERVVELLRWCDAKRYYSARGSFEYMREDGVFPLNDIEVLFQNFQSEPYRQIGMKDVFMPSLSVIDALMNVGPVATAELIKNGTKGWQTWDSMVMESNNLKEKII